MARSKVSGASQVVHKRNFFYYMIYPYVRAFFFRFYSKVEVTGLENIPRNEPVIMAPNHQNATMDALILLFSAPQDIVFLARADIFNNRVMAFFLNSMKMLPVFRQRDGASELGKNVDIFDISVDVLHHRHYLCVMPEGNHGHQRRLRTIVKGIFRIAFKAQEEYGNIPFVKILPVGFDLGHYVKQNQTLLIQYGKPIEMSEYWEQYQENNARGINAMKARLREEMLPLMINIENEEFYETIMELKAIFNPAMREIMGITGAKLIDKFVADKELIVRIDALIEKDPEPIRELAVKVDKYVSGMKEKRIRDWVVRDRGYGMIRSIWRYLSLIVTFPFFLAGFITSAVPYLLPGHLVRNVKDLQFHSSLKAGLGILLLFPLIYLLETLAFGLISGLPWWAWIAFLVALLPLGKAALTWYLRWKKTVRGSWFRRQLRRRKPEAWQMVELRKEIIEQTTQLVS
ncbi:MAG: 1-acyl-sn-glycerol-3-phosphate acyltransferase [Bacteroidales bacterium]|nr:1-acyl-sn-glycerol-3-phosphate acyltransferase [Bacteroidales bacterium]